MAYSRYSSIPEPRLQTLHNETPYEVFHADKMAPGRKYFDTIVAKATYLLGAETLELAQRQYPVAFADKYWETQNPQTSSLAHAGELVLVKPSADIIITGALSSPNAIPRTRWMAGIRVLRRAVVLTDYCVEVTGPRWWRHTYDGWMLTDPEPTREVPIRYELAYGGAYRVDDGSASDDWRVYEPNPSGTGYFDERHLDPALEYRAPQWQLAGQPDPRINSASPVCGFGPIARSWESRIKHAGTYDEDWELAAQRDAESGLPIDYPGDFNLEFFQCAHPNLITPTHLEGGEEIVLTGMVGGAESITFQLPHVHLRARLLDAKGQSHAERMLLDTVHIDLDLAQVFLCWRATLDQTREIHTAQIEMVKNS